MNAVQKLNVFGDTCYTGVYGQTVSYEIGLTVDGTPAVNVTGNNGANGQPSEFIGYAKGIQRKLEKNLSGIYYIEGGRYSFKIFWESQNVTEVWVDKSTLLPFKLHEEQPKFIRV